MKKRRHLGRNIHGILLLDKPTGITSNAALQVVKRLYRARKAGHTGSLDPLANGLLPICLGEATKMSGYLLGADKYYRVLIKLGVKTTTGDAEGKIIASQKVTKINEQQLQPIFAELSGQIEQIPPMHSAVKQNGQPLYKLAHKGIVVERAPRTITIYQIKLLRIMGNLLEVDIHCSKGTYVRTLAEDIGDKLGCGAHVSALRRLGVGHFNGDRMITLGSLEKYASEGSSDGMAKLDALLQPMESALANWPDIKLSQDMAYFLRKGQAVMVPHAPTKGFVKLFAGEQDFMGIGHILEDGRVAPRRLVNI